MKRALVIAVFTLLLASCSQSQDKPEQGEVARITLTLGNGATTRGRENILAQARVLVYKTSDGTLQFNKGLRTTSNTSILAQEVMLRTGRYNIIFVINEMDMGAEARQAIAAGPPTLDDLLDIAAQPRDWPLNTANTNYVMVTHYRDVEILGDNRLNFRDPYTGVYNEIDGGEWSVPLERIGVEIQVAVAFNDVDVTKFHRATLEGAREKSWLVPQERENSAHTYTAPLELWSGDLPSGNHGWAMTKDIGEHLPAPGEKGIKIVAEFSDRTVSAYYNDTIPRNTHLKLNCTVEGHKMLINNVVVNDWDAQQKVTIN